MKCSKCEAVGYCSREHQMAHWKTSHRYLCDPKKYIRGTRIKTSSPLGENSIDPKLKDPSGRSGKTMKDPLKAFYYFKYEKTTNKAKARLIKPGKLTPYVNHSLDDDPNQTRYPYEHLDNQQVCLENGKYRHIASFNLTELRKMGWDGAMYQGNTCRGVWVPLVNGYDSDPEHEYEEVNIRAAMRLGVVGLNDAGLYMETPGNPPALTQLKNPRNRYGI